jgi:hypothetical protein
MKPFIGASLALFMAVSVCANAQWLKQSTPNIPRTAEGKPDLAAPPPRLPDGHPDLSGVWTNRGAAFIGSDDTLTPSAKELVRAREENYFKDRPAFQCRPTGPEVKASFKRIVQTPTLITILYEDLTYRLVFMDGRELEPDPARTWMGYSVGRWAGDTLVVDSFGFNDRTWLDARGLPHTEDLRLTERYRRSTVGEMQVQVTAVDPGVLTTPRTTSYTMAFQPDTEMIEGVWECDQEHWVGRVSDSERTAVMVAPALLASYVGTYSGLWGTVPRTVRVTLTDGTLYATGLLGEPVRLIPQSDTFFMGADGLTFEFGGDGGAITYLVERHVSGDWKYARRP